MANFEVAQGQSSGFTHVAVRPPIEDGLLVEKICSSASSSVTPGRVGDHHKGSDEFVFDRIEVEEHDASLKYAVAAILRASGHSVSILTDEAIIDGPENVFELLADQQSGEPVRI